MSKFNLGFIQHKCSSSKEENLKTVSKLIDHAYSLGGDVICLQELFSTPYFCTTENPDLFDLAETVEGETVTTMQKLAEELSIVLVVPFFEKRAAGVYHNSAAVIDADGSLSGVYRKMHIPDDPGYYEKYYFTPGDTGFTPIQTSIGKLGILICWDQWFPESARLMALAGAEMLIFPTAIGWDRQDSANEKQRQLDAWITIQRSHSIANNLPLISVNRCGLELDPSDQTTGIDFWGNSFACDAMGKIITTCNKETNESCVVDIDIKETEQQRLVWPYFRDRRIDAYSELIKRSID